MSLPADRDAILAYLDALLEPTAFSDYGPNGLQVPGTPQIRRIVSGVTANRALIEAAVQAEAELLLVHHGLFWRGQALEITPLMAGRLRPLMTAGMNLVAYHLPLDAHPEVGNNALIADALGLTDRGRFGAHGGRPLGIAGALPGDGLSPHELVGLVGDLCQPPVAFLHGPPQIRTVGVLSGGGADDIHEAAALGLDAFITGEPEERTQAAALEEGIHFLAAGHHASERFGVRRLGERLAEAFGVEHTFIDIDNPV